MVLGSPLTKFRLVTIEHTQSKTNEPNVSVSLSYVVASTLSFLGLIEMCVNIFNIIYLIAIIILMLPYGVSPKKPLYSKIILMISIFFTVAAGYGYREILTTINQAESLSDFEAADGSGSPIAIIFAAALYALIFMIPWSLALVRSIRRVCAVSSKVEKS